jgi:hypothetical protein
MWDSAVSYRWKRRLRGYLIYSVRKENLARRNFLGLSTFDIPFLHRKLIRLKIHCFFSKLNKVVSMRCGSL